MAKRRPPPPRFAEIQARPGAWCSMQYTFCCIETNLMSSPQADTVTGKASLQQLPATLL